MIGGHRLHRQAWHFPSLVVGSRSGPKSALHAQKTRGLSLAGFFVSLGNRSDEAGLDQGVESTVFGDRFDRLAGETQFHVVTKFRHPDALVLKVGRNLTLHHLGDVTTDTALFLGETGTMNASTAADVGTSDAANA